MLAVQLQDIGGLLIHDASTLHLFDLRDRSTFEKFVNLVQVLESHLHSLHAVIHKDCLQGLCFFVFHITSL